jgi:DNA-binding LytR/AlgR family response regulator
MPYQIEKVLPEKHFFRINRSNIINQQYFTHADQKERKCFLEMNGQNYKFEMKVAKMKKLMRVMMGE